MFVPHVQKLFLGILLLSLSNNDKAKRCKWLYTFCQQKRWKMSVGGLIQARKNKKNGCNKVVLKFCSWIFATVPQKTNKKNIKKLLKINTNFWKRAYPGYSTWWNNFKTPRSSNVAPWHSDRYHFNGSHCSSKMGLKWKQFQITIN